MYEFVCICICIDGRVPGLIYGVDENRNELKIMVTIDQKVLLKGASIFQFCVCLM